MTGSGAGRRLARRVAATKAGQVLLLPRRVLLLPRRVTAMQETQIELLRQVQVLQEELAEVRRRAGAADDAIARLTDGLAAATKALESEVAESRRLSLRVAQMTDLVFERLADAPATLPTETRTLRTA